MSVCFKVPVPARHCPALSKPRMNQVSRDFCGNCEAQVCCPERWGWRPRTRVLARAQLAPPPRAPGLGLQGPWGGSGGSMDLGRKSKSSYSLVTNGKLAFPSNVSRGPRPQFELWQCPCRKQNHRDPHILPVHVKTPGTPAYHSILLFSTLMEKLIHSL